MLEDEKDIYYPKFNVDGLLRGAVEDRMRAYSIAIASGIITSNEARQKENLAPFPPEEGADHPIVNGGYVRLRDVGAAYGRNNPSQGQQTQQQTQQAKPDKKTKSDKKAKPDESTKSDDDEQEDEQEQEQEQEQEEKENKKHTERKKQRKSERRGK